MQFLEYLIKVFFSLAVVYLFYAVFLRRLTFHNSKRWYLLIYAYSSLLIPFINISPLIEKNDWKTSSLVQSIPIVQSFVKSQGIEPATRSLDAWDWMLIVLFAGTMVMMVRLLIQYVSYLKVKRNATVLLDENIRIYQVDQVIIPFSIGNSIFINKDLHEEEELKDVIRHEFIHIKQKHGIDIFLGEILIILNWYNPFAWLIRGSIRDNLEFIADNEVLGSGIDKKQYQYLLLKVVGISKFSIANQFNFSSLKKRIAMMNKNKSARAHLLKFMLLLPLMLVLLLAFRKANNSDNDQINDNLNQEMNEYDSIPGSVDVVKPVGPAKKVLPANVKKIHVTDDLAIVSLENGETERFDLKKEAEKVAFEKKYGKLVPTPPVPPKPTSPDDILLPEGVKRIEINLEKAIVELKNGETETFNFLNKSERAAFENKYGKISPPNPPNPPSVPNKPKAPTKDTKTSQVTIGNDIHVVDERGADLAPIVEVSNNKNDVNVNLSDDVVSTVEVSNKKDDVKVNVNTDVVSIPKNGTVVLVITPNLTRIELDKLKIDLEKKGINLQIKNINYNDSKITSIEAIISKGNSKSTFSVTDFATIIVTEYENDNGKSGFMVNIKESK